MYMSKVGSRVVIAKPNIFAFEDFLWKFKREQIDISGAGHQGEKVKVDPQTQGSAEDALLQMSTYKRSNQASADVNSFPPPRPGSFITWVIW